jgi:benzoate membrane transport protein
MRLIKDFSTSALIAGFVAVLVGFTSSAVIVFQAAQALQATPPKSLPGCVPSAWEWV